MARGRYYCYEDVLPLAALLTAESVNVGVNVLYKAAVTKGLSYHVFMFYGYAISALILLPLAYLFHRKSRLPPFSVSLIGKFFILGLLGFSGQYLGYRGISFSNPTLGSAMSNLNPASTFVLAILFRMEKLNIRSTSSQAKVIGTVVTIAGAFVVVLYKGPILIDTGSQSPTSTNSSVVQQPTSNIHTSNLSAQSNWVLGGALLAASYILSSFWYIIQSKVVVAYPAEFIIVFFYDLFAGIIALPVCLIYEPNLSAWVVPADVRLVSVIYAGVVGTGKWICHDGSHVGLARERASLRCSVQAIVDCHCSHFGCHFSW